MNSPQPPLLIRFAAFELDLRARELRRAGRSTGLPDQSITVLAMLLDRPGGLVLREEIRSRLWPNDTVVEFDHSINSAIGRLRLALGDSAENPRYIETLPRRGYRWIGPAVSVETREPIEKFPAAEAEPKPQPLSASHLIGKKVSHYRVLELLGGGGMGVVYKAEDLKLGRRVALKFLPEELANDSAALHRFESEARSASALNHPNICTIYGVEEYEGKPFLVMELLEGQTLRDLIVTIASGNSTLETAKLLDVAAQIMAGLESAHGRGIIHRDIKPANIFITSQGQSKILDFGLAKLFPAGTAATDSPATDLPEESIQHEPSHETELLAASSPFLSRTGVAMGTAGYMSPEQVRGEKVDARTDLFSFGSVLYEMAAGKRAFAGDTKPKLEEAIVTELPIPAREVNPRVPAELEKIIGRALEKDRDARYQSASQMRVDLENLKREMAPRHGARRKEMAAAGVVILFIASATLWFAQRQPASRIPSAELKLRQLTTNSPENRVLGGGISPNGKYLAYSDQKSLHIKVIETGETWTVPQPEVFNGKDLDWDISFPLWFPDSTTFLANVHRSGQPSSDMGSPGTSIWVASVLGGVPRKLRDEASASSVSPDGSLITFEVNNGRFGDREIWLMGPNGEQARRLYATGEDSSLTVITWSPDGQRLLYRKLDGSGRTIISQDLKAGPRTILFPPSEIANTITDFTWLPDGRLIYPVRDPGAIGDSCNYWGMRLDARTGEPLEKPRQLTNWTGFCMNSTSVTTDGKRLAFLEWSNQGTGYMANLEADGTRIANSRHFTLEDGDDAITDWTADSKTVIIVKNRVDHYGIYKQLLSSDTPELIASGGARGFLETARVSPDGNWIIAHVHPVPGGIAAPRPLMRIPITGGSPELIFFVAAWSGFSCARPPSNTCVVAEPTVDHKQMIATAFDPVRGRGLELARFDLDPFPTEEGAPLCDISPDGTRLATSPGQAGPIQIINLRGRAPQVIRVKDFHNMRRLNWSADGRGLFVEDDKKGGTVLLHVDLQGNAKVLWKCVEVPTCFGTPSPDGRHLGIYDHRMSANMWMMENF